MKNLRLKYLVAALALIWAVEACQTNGTKEVSMKSPMPKADKPLLAHSIDASKGGVIRLPSGSSLEIPADAFVDANGTPVKGEVDIEYREFHDAGSILASGIPMEYTENGVTHSFQTGGMFEIRGYMKEGNKMQLFGTKANRTPIYVAEGKTIATNVASFTGEDDFNFYFFNEKTGAWEFREASTPEPNIAKKEALDKEAPLPDEPVKPEPFNANTPVFNLEVNLNDFPELKEFKGILWQYAGTDPSSDPNSKENQWVAQTAWTDIQINATEEGGVYEAVFTSSSAKKTFVTSLKPVLRGKNYEKALAKFNQKLEKLEEAKTKRLVAEERRAAEGNFMRLASISGFGIYNHDVYFRMKNVVSCNATFSLSNGKVLDKSVYLLAGNNTALIECPPAQWEEFRYPKKDAVLVSVLENGQLAVLSRQELADEKVKKGRTHNFTLKVLEEITSANALATTIQSLW